MNFYLSKLFAIGTVTVWNFFMNYYFTASPLNPIHRHNRRPAMNAKEKMLAGLPIRHPRRDLGREREKATRLLQKFNTLTLFGWKLTGEILRELLPNTTTNA